MGSEAWLIQVMMRFSSNGSRVMREMAAATQTANAAVDAHTARINRATAAMERFRATTVGLGTSIAGAFALAGAGVSTFAAVQAANLQRRLIAIQNETGADPRKMAGVYNSVFDIANKIGVSPNEAVQSWLDVSRLTAGQLSIAQMKKVAPQVLDFASVLHFNRPDVSVDEATKAGLQLVHLFRAYTPKAMFPLLDQSYRLSGLMVETPAQAVRQMSYYEPLFKGLKIDTGTSVAVMALLDRAGFRMKVGTNVRAAMLEALGPLQLTSHAQGAKIGMLEQMGVFNRSGKFAWNLPGGGTNFLGMLTAVSRWASSREASGVPNSEIAKILYGTFGKQGGNIMQLMADPQMLGILRQILAYQRNPNVSLAAGIRNRDNSLSYQAGHAWGNLQAVLTELGWVTLPTLTGEFRKLADTLHNAQTWLHAHRDAERWIAGGFAGLTALAGLRFALGGLGTIGRFMGIFKGLENVSGVSKALMFLDNVAFAGIGQKIIRLGKGIAGLEVANAAAKDVTALGTSLGTLSGARAAAIGLTALGGAITAFLATTGLIAGAVSNALKAAHDPAFAKAWGWSMSGANYGVNAPAGTFPVDVDMAGHVIPRPSVGQLVRDGVHIVLQINDKTSMGVQTQVRTRGQLPSSPTVPKPLNLTSPNLGLSP